MEWKNSEQIFPTASFVSKSKLASFYHREKFEAFFYEWFKRILKNSFANLFYNQPAQNRSFDWLQPDGKPIVLISGFYRNS